MSKEINCAITCGLCGSRLEAWNYDGLIWLLDKHAKVIHQHTPPGARHMSKLTRVNKRILKNLISTYPDKVELGYLYQLRKYYEAKGSS